MVISVDTGNKQIKTKHYTFVAGLMVDDAPPSIGTNTEFMRMDGKYYVLTNGRDTYLRDKTSTERYYDLTVMAVVKELEYMEQEGKFTYDRNTVYPVTLLLGLPPAHYSELKDAYQKYFKRKGETVKVIYHNRTWMFKVNRVAVFAQGFSAIAPIIGEIKKYPEALVCDIGGLTADYVMLNYGAVDSNISDSLERGVIILYQKIKKVCQSKFGSIVEERDVDAILMGNAAETILLYPKEIIDTVYKLAQKFIDDFLGSFREYQIDLKMTYIVFVGGGSLLLRKFIEASPYIGRHQFLDDVNANVTGYELLYSIAQKKAKI